MLSGLKPHPFPAYNILFKTAGIAAWIMVLFIPAQITVFLVWPPPETAVEWFNLFRQNEIIRLIDLDLLLIVDQVIVGLIFLALYILLYKTNRPIMLMAILFAIIGIASCMASTIAFEMLSLSRKYIAATSDLDRSIYLAARESLLAMWQGTTFNIGYVLEGPALLMTAIVMLKSTQFTRWTAYVGILLGILSLLPPTAGDIGMIFVLATLIPLIIWAILVAGKFFTLSGQREHA
jgi:Domain of unknown function (DUF4386)